MGEPCESNAESAERHRLIARKVESRKRKRDKLRRRKKKRFIKWLLTQESDEDEFVSEEKPNKLNELLEEISDDEKANVKSARSAVLATSTVLKQGVQTLTLDDINPHDLYTRQDQPLINGPIDMLYDTGASITMLPLDYTPAWRNLRPCLHQLT